MNFFKTSFKIFKNCQNTKFYQRYSLVKFRKIGTKKFQKKHQDMKFYQGYIDLQNFKNLNNKSSRHDVLWRLWTCKTLKYQNKKFQKNHQNMNFYQGYIYT